MMYKLLYTNVAIKQINKLDKTDKQLLDNWLRKHLKDTNNPRQYGKPLVGNKKGLWRYRIGNYRLIVDIQDDRLIILALNFGHRNNIYK